MLNSKQLIGGYVEMVEEHLRDGCQPTLLSFTFNPLPGSQRMIADQMAKGVEDVYARMLTRIVRKPNSPSHFFQRPIWIVCPDYPVFKRERHHLRDAVINGGRHMHGIALVPPGSRLRTSLADHIDEEQALYSGADRPLFRLHAEDITRTPARAVDYALKAQHHGRASADDIIILPRTRFEMGRSSNLDR